MKETDRTNLLFAIGIVALLAAMVIVVTGCNLMEVHINTDIGDGTTDTVTEVAKDTTHLSLTK